MLNNGGSNVIARVKTGSLLGTNKAWDNSYLLRGIKMLGCSA
jgi:hypothetical protein